MELVKLTPDQKTVALKSIKEMFSALKAMYEWVDADTLYPDMKDTVPHNLEYYLSDLCRAISYDSDSEKKIKERHVELKKANMRIYELEKQIGENADIDIVPKVLKVLQEKISKFWKKEGFGHVSELNFTGWGNAKITFSGMLFPDHGFSTYSKTPETDKITSSQWIKNLKDRGFILAKESDNSRIEEHVIDNEINRKLIIDLIQKRFQTAKVIEFKSHLGYKCEDIFYIRDISVMIYNLSEI